MNSLYSSSPDFLFTVDFIFKTVLLLSVIISLFIFIQVLVFKNKNYKPMFSTWQFPMLLALLSDAAFYKHVNRLA